MPASSLVSLFTVTNNSINSYLATAGKIITITATYNSPATSISGTLNGNALTFSQVGSTSTYIAHYTVVSTDVQGVITLSITADVVTSTTPTDGKTVSIDTVAPSALITYETTGSSLLIPQIGDVHTITLELTEKLLSMPRMNFGYVRTFRLNDVIKSNAPVFVWSQLDDLTWQGTFIITGNEIIPRSILLNLTDLAGNIGILNYNIVQPKFFNYFLTYYYYDEFFNDNQGRYYQSGTGAHSIVSPLVIGENGIGRFTATGGSDVSGYNISKNYLTFLYQSYDYFEATFYLSDLGPSVSGDTALIRFGFVDSDSSNPNYGIYFESNVGANLWNTCTALAGTRTVNSISNPLNVLKSLPFHTHQLKIIYDSVSAFFYVDGTLIDTISYAVPDPIGTGVFPSLGFYISKASGSTQVNFINVDYVELTLKRYTFGDYNADYSTDFYV